MAKFKVEVGGFAVVFRKTICGKISRRIERADHAPDSNCPKTDSGVHDDVGGYYGGVMGRSQTAIYAVNGLTEIAANDQFTTAIPCQEVTKALGLEYFEVAFSNESVDSSDAEWVCIRGTEQPTIVEAQQFMATDSKRIGAPVVGVYPIDEQTARGCYDFDDEANWPIFSRGKMQNGEGKSCG